MSLNEDRSSKASFIVYIDESGDEGFVFRPDGTGSTRWFVLSAAVIRQSNDLQMVACLTLIQDGSGRWNTQNWPVSK